MRRLGMMVDAELYKAAKIRAANGCYTRNITTTALPIPKRCRSRTTTADLIPK